MIKTKSVIVIMLFIGFPVISFGQIYSTPNTNPKIIEMMHRSLIVEKDAYIKVHGNPFVDKDFEKGVIVFKDSSRARDIPLRLNTYTDNIELDVNDTVKVLSSPDIIDHIDFGHRHFIYSRFKEGVFHKNGFFEVLTQGNCKLLLRRESIIKREQLPASNYAGGNYRDYFRTSQTYYIKKGNSPAVRISKSKKSILNALGNHRSELGKYIKDHHLKLAKEDDIIDLIYYYNSLTAGK